MGRTKRFIYIINILNLVIKMENEDKIPFFDKHKKDYKIGDLVKVNICGELWIVKVGLINVLGYPIGFTTLDGKRVHTVFSKMAGYD